MILPRDQFYRILQASRVQTKEEKLAELERLKREKEAALVSCGVFSGFFYSYPPPLWTDQTDRYWGRQSNRQADKTDRVTDRQTCRQSDRQADKTDRYWGGQSDQTRTPQRNCCQSLQEIRVALPDLKRLQLLLIRFSLGRRSSGSLVMPDTMTVQCISHSPHWLPVEPTVKWASDKRTKWDNALKIWTQKCY